MKFGCNRTSSFREIVDGRRRTYDGRTTEPAYTISSPGAFGSGELKSNYLHNVAHVVQLIFISKYVSNILSTNSTTLFFSSLVSEFGQRI